MLDITGDFERNCDVVIAAMIFPRNSNQRAAYCLRNQWSRRLFAEERFNLSASELHELLDLPSREELRHVADEGVRQGTVAGDLLAMIYEQWRLGRPEPSMRSALKSYRVWSVGKKYGDGEPMKYSDMQLRRYFAAAAPAAHLWGAFRLMPHLKADRSAFERDGLSELLAVAKGIQDFATTFEPKRAKPAKPIIDARDMLMIPAHIEAVALPMGPL